LERMRERLIDRPFVLLVAEAYRRSFLDHLTRCRSGVNTAVTEVVLKTGQGREVWVELRSHRVAAGPQQDEFLSVLIDLTERRRLEEERDRLRTATRGEELLRTVLETLPVAVRVVAVGGESLIINDQWRVVWGVARGAPLPALEHQKGWEAGSMRRMMRGDWAVARALRGTTDVLHQMVRIQAFDGALRVVVQSAVPLLDESGAIGGAVEVTEDVTRLVAAQESARHRKEQLEAAFDAAYLSFWDWDLVANRFTWSGPFEQVFGRQGASGDDVGDFLRRVHPDDVEPLRNAIIDARDRRTPFEQELRIVPQPGSEQWISAKGRFAYTGDRATRMTGVVTDITARKQGETELRRAKEAAEEASRLKDDFLATVSHELRTPLSAIMLWCHLARRTLKSEEDRTEAMEIIQRSAKAQSQIVEDLLDISRAISGKLRLNLRAASLETAIRAAMESVRPSADARRIRLDAELGTDLPTAHIDPDRIQQIVWNLLANAIKFTAPGGVVSVHVQAHAEPDGLRSARLTVSDNGPGIEPDFLPHLFNRFRQAESGTTRAHGGLGLGLAIARELVQMHGGTIRAESPGALGGATFVVELPLPTHSNADPLPPSPERGSDSLRGLNVLLVEDEADTRAALRRLLSAAGAHVRAASSADDALHEFQAVRPDVLVSDIAMPGQDGYTLLRRIREIESTAKSHSSRSRGKAHRSGAHPAGHTPAVALTARARAEDRAEAMAAGFQAHLAKPVEPAQLISAVARVTQAAEHPVRQPKSERSSSSS
ncbi:MAG TPA: ATP-binding protein, partial [Tepidisphaeraceae bacterium]|nr:ATP-binding protein [Tepidisphaeraceae bacterium]